MAASHVPHAMRQKRKPLELEAVPSCHIMCRTGLAGPPPNPVRECMENSEAMSVARQPRTRSFTSLGESKRRLATVQSRLEGAGGAAWVSVRGFSLTPHNWPFRRTGVTWHKGFRVKTEIRRGFNADFIINT